MTKDRTKQQDFDLIKGLIDSKEKLDIIKTLKTEDIGFFYLFKCFKSFVSINYLGKTRSRKNRKKVAVLLVSKGLYSTEENAKRSFGNLINKPMICYEPNFKERTYKKAIDLFSRLNIERKAINELEHFYGKNDITYSTEFNKLCEKYNLIPYKERNKLKIKYSLSIPKDMAEAMHSEKEGKQHSNEKRLKEMEKRVQKQKSFNLLKEKKLKIKLFKHLAKTHYTGRTYTQENMTELRLSGCLTLNKFDKKKVLNKIKELEKSIQ